MVTLWTGFSVWSSRVTSTARSPSETFLTCRKAAAPAVNLIRCYSCRPACLNPRHSRSRGHERVCHFVTAGDAHDLCPEGLIRPLIAYTIYRCPRIRILQEPPPLTGQPRQERGRPQGRRLNRHLQASELLPANQQSTSGRWRRVSTESQTSGRSGEQRGMGPAALGLVRT